IMLNPLDGRLAGLLGRVYLTVSSTLAMRLEEKHAALISAAEAYGRAIHSEPFNAVYYWEAGQGQVNLGNGYDARCVIGHAVEIEPNFLPGRDWLARANLEEGQKSLAQAELREIVDRQNRYRDWRKSPLEKEFLATDAIALAAVLQTGGGK